MSRDRDRIMEQALKHELSGSAAPLTADCLDAETLAAWEDNALDAAQMAALELHVSNCVRCQSMAAAMARGTQAPGTLAPGTLAPRSLWSWWLAPIAAATAAVTLWMVVPQQQQIATAPPARDEVAAPSAPKADAPVPTEQKQQAKPEARQDAPKDRVQAPAAAPFAEPANRRERQALNDADKNKAEAGKRPSEEKLGATADAVAAAPSATPPAPSAQGMLQKNARLASTPAEIVSPNSTRSCRIVPAGIEFSTDQGASWIPVRANPNETLTHGVSPSGTICWLIGRNGVVLVTADGSIFAKVDLPVRVDVASITATDARSATVTTVDGRTFRTDDSGRNWRQN